MRAVLAESVRVDGRDAIRVQLTPEAANGKPNVDFIDMPTYVRLPIPFENGTISVDINGGLLPDAPEFARGFAGLAYRIDGDQFECVYLRPANGRRLNPPSPREQRAVQYFAYPDWKFDRLREERPNGGFEAGADVALEEWARLALLIDGPRLRAMINDETVLDIAQTMAFPARGDIGLWVDIGTKALFANLDVTSH